MKVKASDRSDNREIRTTNDERQANIDPIARMIEAKAVMAPMAGVADTPFRIMVRKFGCAFAFTEMVDVNGIYHKNRKTFDLVKRVPEDSPLGIQLVGQDEEKLSYAAKLCEDSGFEVLDLNAGCPARKVVKGGKGAALLKSPVKLAKIVGRLKKEVAIPVTVKIRSGWDENNLNYLEVARAVASEGASAICIHSRTRKQMYRGKVRHHEAREIKEEAGIPVFVSGNILKPESVPDILRTTGCDAVFVARGALGRPWIFSEIKAELGQGKALAEPTFGELKTIIAEHFKLNFRFHGEWLAFKRMYKHLCWYLMRFKNLDAIMREYIKIRDIAAFESFLGRIQLENGKYLRVTGDA
jgi:tRNA-dihydrouridine synthase B